jgi:phosphinothricin acetyltransferase
MRRANVTDSARLGIRLADPARDGARVAAIYRPAVESSSASFETVAPTTDEMAERIAGTLSRTPWLVAIDGSVDGVVGYAYAGRHHERAAYRWSVDVSVYVDPAWHRRGVGRVLYAALFDALRLQGFVNVYAGMTLPNDGSMALHRAFGLEPIGVYHRVGYKSGRWHDVAWFGTRLQEPPDPPAEPVLLPDFLTTPTGRAWHDTLPAAGDDRNATSGV